MSTPSRHRAFGQPARICRRGGIGHGFTLIELLVVMSIIAMLIALLLPALRSARESAQAIQCGSVTRTMGVAFSLYAMDYEGWINPTHIRSPQHWDGQSTSGRPWPERFSRVGPGSPNDYGLVYPRDYHCPTIDIELVRPGGSGAFFAHYGINPWIAGDSRSGDYFERYHRMETLTASPSAVILAAELKDTQINNKNVVDYSTFVGFRHHDTANILFADGHVQPIKIEFFEGHSTRKLKVGRR